MSRRTVIHQTDRNRLETVLAIGLAHTRLTNTPTPPTSRVKVEELFEDEAAGASKVAREGGGGGGGGGGAAPLAIYDLPEELVYEILLAIRHCKDLTRICSGNRMFRRICADETHKFWSNVLQRQGWTIDWPSKDMPGGLFPKQFYKMMCGMEEDYRKKFIGLSSTETTIPAFWMQHNKKLVIKALPSSITTIERQAFRNCTSLALEALPPALEKIELAAFDTCTSLALEEFPTTLKSIENWTFRKCESLAFNDATYLPPNLVIGFGAFSRCELPDEFLQRIQALNSNATENLGDFEDSMGDLYLTFPG
jgi:hypothetical protein